MAHVAAVAQAPHPTGSPEQDAVRGYLVGALAALGVPAEVQHTTALRAWGGGQFSAGAVHNVLARLEGAARRRRRGKAVVLVRSYNSVATGPGASDDGAAVAALLETLRALRAGPPLRNDVVFLFTDGEERGLLGATAFAAEHPRMRDAGLVLNLEARGHTGRSLMFETTGGNGRLVRELGRAAPYPDANSLSSEIYKRLPNNSDLTVFREAGVPGMNFAYTDGVTHYHTRLDSVANVDRRSLQHHGAFALSLARHFGDLPLDDLRGDDAVYFNSPAGAGWCSTRWRGPSRWRGRWRCSSWPWWSWACARDGSPSAARSSGGWRSCRAWSEARWSRPWPGGARAPCTPSTGRPSPRARPTTATPTWPASWP